MKTIIQILWLACLIFASEKLFAQPVLYSMEISTQLRSNSRSLFFPTDQLAIRPGSTISSIGIGLLGRRAIKYKGRLSIETGLIYYKNTTPFIVYNVAQNQVLANSTHKRYKAKSISIPYQILLQLLQKSTTQGWILHCIGHIIRKIP